MAVKDEAILLVDDEENILSALQRVFRPEGHQVSTATRAEEGLAVLERQPISLIISDNGMPGMSGVQFLKRVRERWPDTIRIMLTGYTDFNAAMDAINRGEVYRFVTKPWDPDDLRSLVRQGLEQFRMVQENRQMRELIEQQNAQLKSWNQNLQQTVEARTEELRQKNGELEALYEQIKGSFVNAIKVFTGFIELRNPAIGGHARRVAALSKPIARYFGMSDDDVKNVEVAGLLHDIGKIGLPDELLRKNQRLLSTEERAVLKRHAVLGQAALQIVETLDPIATIVRHHHECWDGNGYPDGLKGEAIPPAARIIAVANAYDHYRHAKPLVPEDFTDFQLSIGYTGAFDPDVMSALQQTVAGLATSGQADEIAVAPRELREGMMLSRDLRSSTGIVLVPKGETLKQSYLDKLRLYEGQKLIPSTVWVYGRPARQPA